jgi:hypothetical protein
MEKKRLNYLRSPVTKRFFTPHSIPDDVRLPYAGLSALSHYSMLAEPRNGYLQSAVQSGKNLKIRWSFSKQIYLVMTLWNLKYGHIHLTYLLIKVMLIEFPSI